MTHLLEINDNDNVQLFDMLGLVLGMDLASRQISPVANGRWEERYRMFGGDSNTPRDIADKVFLLDQIVTDINNYGESPSLNTPIWLHEKSEGETSEVRHAPLFRATFQPTAEGSVGQLQINNGFVGLLMLERGTWEDMTISELMIFQNNSPTITFPPENTFGTVALAAGKSNDGRVASIIHTTTGGVSTTIIAAGIRATNLGVANFQNCFSLGSGVTNTPTSNFSLVSNANCTVPDGQTKTYNMVNFKIYNGVHTHKLLLNEVSENTLDTHNKDYVGDYNVYLRWANANGYSGEYTKVHLSYGFEGNMIDNAPIYTTQDASANGWHLYPMHLGRISIPTYPYRVGEGAVNSLSEFTLSVTAELVNDLGNNTEFWADSLFLIPVNDMSYTADYKTVIGDLTDAIYNHPDGGYYSVSTDKTNQNTISMDMTVPNGGGLVSYYRLANYSLAGSPTFELALSYYDRYNSLSDS